MMVSGKLLFLSLILFLEITSICSSVDDVERKPYIVYLGNAPESQSKARDAHHSLLHVAIGDEQTARESLIHSYSKSFNAFAARLQPEEAKKLLDMDGVVSVFPNSARKLHTTRSWDFLGFPKDVRRSVGRESNVVVGLLDCGIWPHSPSFQDKGFGPPPAKWRGKCENSANFTCNNKIVGARFYHLTGDVKPPDVASPMDTDGHGTHTSSTVAGMTVEKANLYGLAEGTARGGVPSARIAMYKVCWIDGCQDIDILAGFDQAIYDGVDVISVSLGGYSGEYFTDSIAIGSFHAMKNRILVSCSAGNDGPYVSSISNVAPWILTVAASSIDRQFRTQVRLGNGKKITGVSINTFSPAKRIYPLTSGALAGKPGEDSAVICSDGTLDKAKAKGKIILCQPGYKEEYSVKTSGGEGIIIASDGELMDVAFTSTIPSSTVDPKAAEMIARYINSTRNPQAVIYKTRAINISIPFVASFSSRGPNLVSQHILKPDVTAPGLDILAAYTRLSSITGDPADNRVADYNILSGTSMSCPHVSGAAVYVKSFHPTWSPAAIKSALMTTAQEMRPSTPDSDAEFGYGSGQISPLRATHPGLVYDIDEMSYKRFLCNEGYNGTMIGLIAGSGPVRCSSIGRALGSDGLNYPTMHHQVNGGEHIYAVFRRTVTNVGLAKSVYKATVRAPKDLSVVVTPSKLVFNRLYQKRSFKVVVKGGPLGRRMVLSASLVWKDSKHTVRSPIVIGPKAE